MTTVEGARTVSKIPPQPPKKIAPPPPPVEKTGTHDDSGDDYNPRELEQIVELCAIYSPAFANRILDRIEEGYTLERVEAECNGPSPRIVYGWAKKCAMFNNAFVDSLEVRAEVLMDQIVTIADGAGLAMTKKQRIETRKELAAFDNKRFVKRSTTQLTGADGGPLDMRMTMQTPFSEYTEEQQKEWVEEFYHYPIGTQRGEEVAPEVIIPIQSVGHMNESQLASLLRGVPKDELQAALNLYNKPDEVSTYQQADETAH